MKAWFVRLASSPSSGWAVAKPDYPFASAVAKQIMLKYGAPGRDYTVIVVDPDGVSSRHIVSLRTLAYVRPA